MDDTGQAIPMHADFRDTSALVYVPTGNFIGISRQGTFLLGQNPEMIHGLWYLTPHAKAISSNPNITLSKDNVDFRVIG